MDPISTPASAPTLAEAHRFFDGLERLVRGEGDLAELLGIPEELVALVADHGDRLLAGGRFAAAREVYETCLAMTPGDWTLAHRLGLACRGQGEAALAERCLDAAARMRALLDPAAG